ncbi:hypothetical protein DXT96_07430 [Agrobacterium sp. ICMP 6402]|nr:hypothetical protein [Agrobacterium sp. ICMP 6402]
MAGGKSYRGWKPAKAQHQALTPKQQIPAAKTFRAISALDPVPDQSKMTATQALMVQRMAERTAPFPERLTTSPEVLEGEALPLQAVAMEVGLPVAMIITSNMSATEIRMKMLAAMMRVDRLSRQT